MKYCSDPKLYLVDLAVLGLWLDLMILKVFSNLNDSVNTVASFTTAKLETFIKVALN